jgi:hypothetical protein
MKNENYFEIRTTLINGSHYLEIPKFETAIAAEKFAQKKITEKQVKYCQIYEYNQFINEGKKVIRLLTTLKKSVK